MVEEKDRIRYRVYYETHKEAIKLRNKEWLKRTNYASIKKWQAKNKDKLRIYERDYARDRSEIWKSLPNEKKLELMNNLCVKLINK